VCSSDLKIMLKNLLLIYIYKSYTFVVYYRINLLYLLLLKIYMLTFVKQKMLMQARQIQKNSDCLLIFLYHIFEKQTEIVDNHI
jgi:hypothetical protein